VVPVIAEHIEVTPGVCGGKPRIAGHRIRVQDVVLWHERMGMSPEEITVTHPGLTLSDVYAALAYYYDHLDEIRGFLEQEEAIASALEAQQPSLLEKIVTRRNAQDGPLPPG
jgi:uncharacterized protein (DUF433 family)